MKFPISFNYVARIHTRFFHTSRGAVYGLIFVMFAGSCTTTKNVPYFQDLSDTSKIYTQVIKRTYEAHIQPDDIPEIIISNINTEAAAPFNVGNTNPALNPASQIIQGATGIKLNARRATNNDIDEGYYVDKNVTINFPVLRKMKVEGLTIPQLKDSLKIKLANIYWTDRKHRLFNYKIHCVG